MWDLGAGSVPVRGWGMGQAWYVFGLPLVPVGAALPAAVAAAAAAAGGADAGVDTFGLPEAPPPPVLVRS